MKIRDQITEQTWCKGSIARTADGEKCDALDSRASSWCLLGWTEKVYPNKFGVVLEKLERPISLDGYGRSVMLWQDAPECTFEQVKWLLERVDV